MPTTHADIRLRATGYALGIVILLAPFGWAAPPVRWLSGSEQAIEKSAETLRADLQTLAARPNDRHVVVQFAQPLGFADQASLQAAGLTLQIYLGSYAYFASTSSERLNAADLSELFSLTDVRPIERRHRIHPYLLAGNVPQWALVAAPDPEGKTAPSVVGVYVLFHKDERADTSGANVALMHGARIRSHLKSVNGLVIEIPFGNIAALGDEDVVQWIEPALPKFSELNNSNRDITGANIVQAPPYGLDGSGVQVLVYDGGYGRASHVDFGGRLTVRDSSGLSDHATHVSGTVGGSGQASGGLYKGMAPGVTIESYGFEQAGGLVEGFLYTDPGDLEADYNEAINTFGAVISNNSIGTNTAPNGFPCEWEGNYGVTSALIDAIVRGSLGSPFRVVWANGNERQGGAVCGSTYNTTAPPACAKNHITVGALNSNDDSVTSFTSWGPADDGRIKPDVSAPGCQSNDDNTVTSCSSSGDTSYTGKCGTSMACPTVTGLSALLLQDFRAQNPGEPDFRNSTLKALLANTAEDIQNTGPDYQTGYGSVRIQRAIDAMRAGNFLEAPIAPGGTFSALVLVNPGESELKITLAWDDLPGTPNVDPALINDLDLVVRDPSGVQHFPWTLDPANPSVPAVQNQADRVNNIEQVQVNSPAAGAWRVEVQGFSMALAQQVFSLAAAPTLIKCSTQGFVSLDRTQYGCQSNASIQVIDCDLNTDDNQIETVDVTIVSNTEPAGELVTLTETAAESAAFLGAIDLDAVNAPGVLNVAAGDTVTVTYIDADDGFGGLNVVLTSEASVDCLPPVISGVQTTSIGPRDATIVFTTDEAAIGQVSFGVACNQLTGTAQNASLQTAHSIPLTGLSDGTPYFYAVHAADEAGNATTDDNGGACFTFMTPEIPDSFTEEFTGDNDLDNLSIEFIPNGSFDFYAACSDSIFTLPVDPAGGATIGLSDDDFQLINLSGGAQVSLYGVTYSSFFVGSNGYVTFGAGDTDYSETLADHFDMPRISALFDDLNPAAGGTVSWEQLSDRAVVTWNGVFEFGTANANTFQIEMFFDGRLRLTYLDIPVADGIVGLSEGLGLPPDYFEFDLSAANSCGPQPPSVPNQNVDTPAQLPVLITLSAFDDGFPDPPGQLTFLITSLPTSTLADSGDGHVIVPGDLPYALIGGGNQLTYTSDAGFGGSDPFQYIADDGGVPPEGGQSNIGTVTVNVVPVLELPFVDTFDSTIFDTGKWATVSDATIDSGSINPPSPPLAMRLNGDPNGGDDVRTHLINLSSAIEVELTYFWQRTGTGNDPESGENLIVEFLDNSQTWQLINEYAGDGPDMTVFQEANVILPTTALHSAFRLRFRNSGTSGAFDDWFVDDVQLIDIGLPSDCNGNEIPDDQEMAGCPGIPACDDCNNNMILDECDIADCGGSPACGDCNVNGIPDECDLADCVGSPDCDDCNANGMPDACDIADGTATDNNGNLVPDSCESAAPLVNALGGRYLEVIPQPQISSLSVALKLEVLQAGGGTACMSAYIQADGTLDVGRVMQTPANWGVLVVTGVEIVPEVQYAVVVELADGTLLETSGATTPIWGDVNNNTIPNLVDAQAVVQVFQGQPGATSMESADLEPCIPNRTVNLVDAQKVVKAFQGEDYAATGCPMPCP